MALPADYKLTIAPLRHSPGAVTYSASFAEEGWVTLMVNAATGFVAIASDWLSGTFFWKPTNVAGGDVLRFVATPSRADYLCCKLWPDESDVMDVEATKKAIRKLARGRHRGFTADEILSGDAEAEEAAEGTRTDDDDDLDDLINDIDNVETDNDVWALTIDGADTDDIGACIVRGPSPHFLIMRDHVLPAFLGAIREDLKAIDPPPPRLPRRAVQHLLAEASREFPAESRWLYAASDGDDALTPYTVVGVSLGAGALRRAGFTVLVTYRGAVGVFTKDAHTFRTEFVRGVG